MSEHITYTSTLELIRAIESLPGLGSITLPGNWPNDEQLTDDDPRIASVRVSFSYLPDSLHTVYLTISHLSGRRDGGRTLLQLPLQHDAPRALVTAFETTGIHRLSFDDRQSFDREWKKFHQWQYRQTVLDNFSYQLLAIDGVTHVNNAGYHVAVASSDSDKEPAAGGPQLTSIQIRHKRLAVAFTEGNVSYSFTVWCKYEDFSAVSDRIEKHFLVADSFERKKEVDMFGPSGWWDDPKNPIGFLVDWVKKIIAALLLGLYLVFDPSPRSGTQKWWNDPKRPAGAVLVPIVQGLIYVFLVIGFVLAAIRDWCMKPVKWLGRQLRRLLGL